MMRLLKLIATLTVSILVAVSALCGCTEIVKGKETPFVSSERLSAAFLNTGDSDCSILSFDGIVILIDAALDSNYNYIAAKLEEYKISRIDYMILTHFDNDHIGSANEIIKNFDIGEIIVPDYIDNTQEYQAVQDIVAAKNTPYTVLKTDRFISTSKGEIWINAPAEKTYNNENNFSLITSITYGSTKMLFLGDALKVRLKEFNDTLASKGDGAYAYNLIKTPHHGDYFKVLNTLLSASKAQYAVVCTGSDRRVDTDLFAITESCSMALFRTFSGEISVHSDGESLTASQG